MLSEIDPVKMAVKTKKMAMTGSAVPTDEAKDINLILEQTFRNSKISIHFLP
jgi:hypothetical protein